MKILEIISNLGSAFKSVALTGSNRIPTLIGMLVMLLVLPVGVYLSLNRQIFEPQASYQGAPKGYLVSQVNCSGEWQIYGWTCDPDVYTRGLGVRVYADNQLIGTLGPPTTSTYTYPGDTGVAAQCGGYGNHWFRLNVPDSIRGRTVQIRADAIDQISNGFNSGQPDVPLLLSGTNAAGSTSVNCPLNPTVSVQAAPITLTAGQSATITTTTANIPSGVTCSNNWNFTYPVPINGSSSDTRVVSQTFDFTVTCSNGSTGSARVTAIPAPPPVNATWSDWSACSATCGTGSQTRTCTAEGSNGGRTCAQGPADGAGTSRSCNTHACPPVNTAPTAGTGAILNADGSVASLIRADGSTRYIIRAGGNDNQGTADMTSVLALVNINGTYAGQHRGYAGWSNNGSFPYFASSYKSTPIDCGGGGKGTLYNGYGSEHMNLISCSTSGSGTTRLADFTVTFNNSFTAPPAGNTIGVFIADTAGAYSNWQPFSTFGLVPGGGQLGNGICIMRTSSTSLPQQYSAAVTGTGYAKINKPSVANLDAVKAACSAADFASLLTQLCQNNTTATGAQQEVAYYNSDGTFASNTCGSAGCNTVACPARPTPTPTVAPTPTPTARPTNAPTPTPASTPNTGNLVSNGGFESPVVVNTTTTNLWQLYGLQAASIYGVTDSIPGWAPRQTGSGYQVEVHRNLYGQAPEGNQYAEIDAAGIVTLVQPLSTVMHATYKIEFLYAPRPDAGEQSLGVYWNGQLVSAVTGTGTAGSPPNWQTKTFNVSATSTNSILGFGSIKGNGAGNFIDKVSVTLVTGGQCTAGPFQNVTIEEGENCGVIVSKPASGATSGTIKYTAPNVTHSEVICNIKVTTPNNGGCTLTLNGMKGKTTNPIKPGETVDIAFSNQCGQDVSIPENYVKSSTANGCTIPLFVSPKAAPPPNSDFTYKIAETEEGLASAPEKPFDGNEKSFNATYILADQSPGLKSFWVEFKKTKTGETKRDFIQNVRLLAKDPKISGVNCSLALGTKQLVVDVRGSNFGTDSDIASIKVNGNALKKTAWENGYIKGVWENPTTPVADGSQYTVNVTLGDGRGLPQVKCGINLSIVSLGSKLFCRGDGNYEIKGAVAVLVDEEGNKIQETIDVGRDGSITGIKTKLSNGKNYVISIKAPKIARTNVTFTAQTGTTVVVAEDGSPIVLPLGDIAPRPDGDGVINTLDRSLLIGQWRTSVDATTLLSGDLNVDRRVNAFDWACMRNVFNRSEEKIPDRAPRSGDNGGGEEYTIPVDMKNFQFQPAEITMSLGDSVTWTNNDATDHTVVAADGSFNSGKIPAGQTYTHKFDKAGTFQYQCSIHPSMKGTIRVIAPTPPPVVCATPPACSGNLIIGDPQDGSCPRYVCSTPGPNPASCTADAQCQTGFKCFNHANYPGTCKPSDTVCAAVITRACKDEVCADFPSPCHVPPGWTTGGRPSPSPSGPQCTTNALGKTPQVTSNKTITWTYTYPASTKINSVNFPAKTGIKYTVGTQTAASGQPLVVNFGAAAASSFQFTVTTDTACMPFTAPFTMVNSCGTTMNDLVGMGTARAYGQFCP